MRVIAEMNLRIIKQRMLVHEARKWLNFTEQGGNNRGQAVELFQKFVDGTAVGEPWCMAFVQFLCDQVDLTVDSFFAMSLDHRCQLFRSEHCLTVFNKTHLHLHITKPEQGAITVWQKGSLTSGHTGVVSDFTMIDHFNSIEGNTGPQKVMNRDGDGVFEKSRYNGAVGDFHIKGWIRPWDDLLLSEIG